MSQGVFTPELRFTWVKGQVTSGDPDEGFVACGDGTLFPLRLTLTQLAEVMYRVKNFHFNGGGYTTPFGGGALMVVETITAPPPIDNVHTTIGGGYHQRSYTVLADDDFSDGTLLTDAYEVTFSAAENYKDYKEERSMWLGLPYNYIYPYFGSLGDNATPLPFAFSFYSYHTDDSGLPAFGIYSYNEPTGPPPTIYNEAEAFGYSSLQVAYTGNSPTDLSGQFFLNYEFFFQVWNGFVGDELSTYRKNVYVDTPEDALTYCNFVLELSDSTVSCPIYFPGEGIEYNSVSDFVLKATEWWPYAKDSPAVPVWNAETGARL